MKPRTDRACEAAYRSTIADIDEKHDGNLPVKKFRPTWLRHQQPPALRTTTQRAWIGWMRAAPVRPCARLGSRSSLGPGGRLGAGEQTKPRVRCRPCPCPRRAAGPGASGAWRCECAARCAWARSSRSTVRAHSEESVCSRQMLSGNCPRKLWPLRSLQRCVHTHSRRKGRWIERSSAARANALTFALSFRGTTGRPA